MITVDCNSFQRSMWQWDAMRPYNAVHAALTPFPYDSAKFQAAAAAALACRGVGSVQGGRRVTHETLNDPPHIAVATSLPGKMRSEINTPFRTGDGAFCPFRFFVLPQGEKTWVGLSYFHAVADASAITALLRDMAGKLADPALVLPAVPALPASKPASGFLRWLLRLPRHQALSQRLHSPALHEDRENSNGLILSELPPARWKDLKNAAKAWGVTLNDVFLAALLLSQETIAVDRFKLKRKKLMAATCVVSGREAEDRAFGLKLGLFRVVHPVPQGITLQALARDIKIQTARLKRNGEALALDRDLGLARFLNRVFPLDSKGKFYHKYNPSWGGVTNMNLESLTSDGLMEDYWRSVSTGPVTPVALSVTSAASALRIGFSYRTAVHPDLTAQFLHKRLHALLCLKNP